MTNVHRLRDDAVVDVSRLDVLLVAQALRQRHDGRVAVGLCFDVVVDGVLQPAAGA